MNVAVIGASGRTGRLVVELALKKGWTVRALVRDAAKLALNSPLLTVVVGDATVEADVAKVLEGTQATINAAGPVKGGHPELMQRLSKALQKGFSSTHGHRIVWLSGAGVKLPGDKPDALRSVVRGLMKLIAASVLRDSEAGVTTILALGDRVTVVRVPMLSDEATKGSLFLSDQPSRPVPAGRSEVAQLLVDQVEDTTWAGKAPFAGVK